MSDKQEKCDNCGKGVYEHDLTSAGDSDLCDDCYCDTLSMYDEVKDDK